MSNQIVLDKAQRYRLVHEATRYFSILWKIFLPFTVAMAILFFVIVVLMVVVPVPLTAGFLTRARTYNLDLTVLYYWVCATIQFIILVVTFAVVRPWDRFSASASYQHNSFDIKKSVRSARTLAIVNIVYALLMIVGLVLVNVFLFLSYFNSEAPPFSAPDPTFDYSYDQMALVMSYIVAVLELIIIGVYAYAIARPLAKTIQDEGNSHVYVRTETYATQNGASEQLILLFKTQKDADAFDKKSGRPPPPKGQPQGQPQGKKPPPPPLPRSNAPPPPVSRTLRPVPQAFSQNSEAKAMSPSFTNVPLQSNVSRRITSSGTSSSEGAAGGFSFL